MPRSSLEGYPTRSELPSKDERDNLVEELARLRAELETAREKRNALRVSAEAAGRAEKAIERVAATVEENAPSNGAILSDVTRLVEGGHTVKLLTEEATTLVEKLERIKRDRSNNSNGDGDGDENNNDGGFDFVQRDDPLDPVSSSRYGSRKRQKPLSLEEAYRRDRRRLGLLRDSTNEGGVAGEEESSGVESTSIGATLEAVRSMIAVPRKR